MAKVVNRPDGKMIASITGTKPPKNSPSSVTLEEADHGGDEFMELNEQALVEAVNQLGQVRPPGSQD